MPPIPLDSATASYHSVGQSLHHFDLYEGRMQEGLEEIERKLIQNFPSSQGDERRALIKEIDLLIQETGTTVSIGGKMSFFIHLFLVDANGKRNLLLFLYQR
jgi:hypothetical protein